MSPAGEVLESAADHGFLLQFWRFDASHWNIQRYTRFRHLGAADMADLEIANTSEKEIEDFSRVRYRRAVSAIISLCLHQIKGSGSSSIDQDELMSLSFD